MLTESRTQHEIFEAWKTTKPNIKWVDYKEKYYNSLVELYKKNNWSLIDIVKNQKVPLANKSWVDKGISYNTALNRIKMGFNIGVNLYKSNLIVADIDDNIIPDKLIPYVYKTMSAITKSSHYHIYFIYDREYKKSKLDKLAESIGYPNLWRGKPNKPQYTVIPPSFVDNKFYEWIYIDKLMGISELIGELN
jgi:hypothetical protein